MNIGFWVKGKEGEKWHLNWALC